MSGSSIQSMWQAVLERDREALAKEAQRNPFVTWEKLASPHFKIGGELSLAIDIACANPEHPLVQEFANRAVTIGERALDDPRWQGEWSQSIAGFPFNRARLIRAYNYARWMTSGQLLDLRDFAAASRQIEDWTADTTDWDDPQEQSVYLLAVNLALVAGDVARAAGLLNARKKLRYERQWQGALQAATAARSASDADHTALLAHFDVFFDAIRTPKLTTTDDPITDTALLRLEMSVLRHACFRGGELPTDWRTVVRMISD
jgi:hypothetical protein